LSGYRQRALPVIRGVPVLVGAAALVMLLLATTSTASGAGSNKLRLATGQITPGATYYGSKSISGEAARTDKSLLGLSGSRLVPVMIKYDFDATASYTGRITGLRATSPRMTGKSLRANTVAVARYNRYAQRLTGRISGRVKSAVPGVRFGTAFRNVYGGVAARVPANQISKLLSVRGVSAVQRDSLRQPLDDNTEWIGARKVWRHIGGKVHAGQNVKVGVIDTGVWPEHPMLADKGLPPVSGTFGCQFGDGSDVAHLGPTFTCNDKLIGAYAKTATYMANIGALPGEFCNNGTGQCSARDSEGHGTHTTTTAAGDCVESAILYGVERGPVCGIAPGARVIQYRVCLEQGCFSSDSVSAVAQAIADGINVINFSISGGAQPYSDPVELAFLDATNAGISVNASAGNAGPGAGTSDHGGPWTTTVGASTGPRFFTSTLHLTADGGATFDKDGVTLTDGISSPTSVILAQSIPGEDALCQTKLSAGSAAAGKIVLCQRGVNARVDKGYNVAQGGAAGMILYNTVKQDVETDNHWLPAIHVDGPNTDLLTFVNTHTNVMATFAQGTATPTQADVMAAFSSRGPLGDWIKPDVTAPGIQVLAGMTPQPTGTVNGPPGNLYQAIAGTSMSSPHSAGVSALVKAAHPWWTPAMIKSALMTSAVGDVVKEDGVTPATPFDDGAGSIRANRAVKPTLVFDENYADFVAAGTDPLHRIDLNLASINATTMAGEITTKRVAINVSHRTQVFHVETTAPDGSSIIVSDHKPGKNGPGKGDKYLVATKWKPLVFWVTISAPKQAPGQYFGEITLDPKAWHTNSVHMPVAWVKKQGAVTLTHTCAPLSFQKKTGKTHCTANVANFSKSPANTSVEITGDNNLDYSNPSAGASLIHHGDGVEWSGTLSPAIPPQVNAISSTTGPAGGYLPLSLFGIAPIAGVGDDTITNFNVPTFMYGGEPYSRIGVVSNGYVVIGGGTSSDIQFTPQNFPNAAVPNNVVAPLWNDMNPPAGGAIRIGTLTDGVSTWLVVDYAAVKNFSNATTHTFQLWFKIGTTPASEEITITYGAGNTATPDPGSGGNSGAENRDGTSGKNLTTPANNTEWAVVLAGPTAGGTADVSYDASSKKAGTYDTTAAMTSDQTPGIAQVVQTLTVTP
jgi:Subtilase family/PA domain